MTRRTIHKIILIAWLAVFLLLGFGVWSFQGGELMLIVYLVASVILYILYALLARCPRCGMPLLLRPRKVLGMELYTWAILTPERCRHCGADL